MAKYDNKNTYKGNQSYTKPSTKPVKEISLTPENYVDQAEDVIANRLEKKGNNFLLTTSKIRNILSMVTELYDDVIHYPEDKMSADIVERIQYLRLRIAYEAGREASVKNFVEESDLLNQVKKIGSSKKNFLLFCKYVEALVAYHRFYGGRE